MKNTKIERVRHDNDMVVAKTTLDIHSAVIEWQEILDCITVEPDDGYYETPWEDCDGYDHRLVPVDGPEEDGFAAFIHDHRWVAVEMEFDQELYDWYRQGGASKGVAEQLTRQSMRKRTEQLVSWHEDGWEWWSVRGEMHGCFASVGGVDDYDYANTDCREDIAYELAHDLERLGYEITGEPEKSASYKQAKQDRLKRNLNLFNM